jgi:hypothetical protein
MCSCKRTPIQRLETRLKSRGWADMRQSDYNLLKQFIIDRLGVVPENDEQIRNLYPDARKA